MKTIKCISGMGITSSPFFDSYATDDSECGLYNGRVFPWRCGESATEDYWALRRGAVLFDVPETPIAIEGPDAVRLLDRVLTRSVAGLKIGRAAYGLACLPDGGMLMDGVLMRLGEERFWYVQAEGEFRPWLLAHAVDRDVSIYDPDSWVLQVQGPRSFEVLAAACDDQSAPELRYFDVAECRIGGQPLIVSRTGWTGELGFELYSTERDFDGAALWTHLLDRGKSAGLIWSALRSMQIRRIEAGILDYGTDMDAGTTPFQAGLGKFVDLSRSAFIGKSALERADQRPLLYGVRCGDGVPVYGTRAELDSQPVGRLLSSAWSPFLNCGIGYVRMDAPGEWAGTRLQIPTLDGALASAEVVMLPFYDPEKRIARGLAVCRT